MKKSKFLLSKSLPVFTSFVILGFDDIVGVATGFIKQDFNLTDDIAQLVPSMALFWFFVLAVPAGILQDRLGKKRMLNFGIFITGLGMLIPVIYYSFPLIMIAFVFLGIGNTIVHVSANPLLYDVSPKEKYSSYMSFSQFLKASISLLGPIITTFVAIQFGDWKLVFAIYSITSFLSAIWLYSTRIPEMKSKEEPATFSSCFSLLKNRFILALVLGIFMLVGADVGMNSNIANFLMNRFELSLENASLGISLYFLALMIGRLLGAVILNWVSSQFFLLITSIIALTSLVSIMMAPTLIMTQVAIFMVGLGSGNLFPLIFSLAIEHLPKRSNEISGLMIMAISGGAVLPPIMGQISTNIGVKESLIVLIVAMTYLVGLGIYSLKKYKYGYARSN
ncbi:MFS transporter [Membranihabitans maritimus]|uniref:MFS transporter n=1 Tax=Membranihabitans maritimus TaxID=2904244 RepID=UPI001F00BA2E|nr:MFS transporter [Membranihabitans maritimus]